MRLRFVLLSLFMVLMGCADRVKSPSQPNNQSSSKKKTKDKNKDKDDKDKGPLKLEHVANSAPWGDNSEPDSLPLGWQKHVAKQDIEIEFGRSQ